MEKFPKNKSLKTPSKNLLLAGNVELNFVNKQAVTTTTRKLKKKKKTGLENHCKYSIVRLSFWCQFYINGVTKDRLIYCNFWPKNRKICTSPR